MSVESHWEEIFRAQPETREPRPAWRPPGWLVDWEQWLTLGVMLLVVLSAAFSVQAADWVPGMPSLAVPSLAALLAAMFLARVRVNELLLHPPALASGLVVVTLQVLRFLDGGVRDRLRELWDRMVTWVEVVRAGGISTDNLPFVVIVLSLTWLAAYVGGWAAFRWRNGWLAAVPSGVALLVNLSYQPGGFSPAFVVFALGALLLLARTHVADAARRWRQEGVEYPQFLSLLTLNGTAWVGLLVLVLVLLFPTAGAVTAFTGLWEKVRSPVESWTVDWGLFTTVNAKKPVPVHRFGDTMPLQGAINLHGREVARVTAGSAPYPVFLRAAVYEVYAGTGWKAGPRTQMPAEHATQSPSQTFQRRHEVTATVDPSRSGEVLLGPGQPIRVEGSVQAEVVQGAPLFEIARLLRDGSRPYDVTGTISAATADELRQAGTNYPTWVRERYLQLPEDLPDRVRQLAREWAGRRDNPYDIAKAIEDQLRTYPIEYDIPVAPPGADAVDYFLFEERRGYFDYHASAMAVLLRTLGIPSRVVVGYQLVELDPASTDTYIVRERDAFAWVEVFFPGYGWVEFNPTTGSPTIDRGAGTGADAAEALPEEALPPDLLPAEPEFPVEPVPFFGEEQGGGGRPWAGYLLGGLAALLVVGSAGGWLFWQALGSGLAYPAQVWEKTVRLASWARVPPLPHETPAETARRIGAAVPGGRDAETLAAAYVRHRYGRKLLTAVERRELAQAWSRLRNRLVARALRWR